MSNKTPQDLSDEQLEVLEAFARALGQEAHVLRQRPDLLWQQLYNRLQWVEEPAVKEAIQPEFIRRTTHPPRPWAHNLIRPRESRAIVMTLIGHTGGVNSAAYSPDGKRIVSASDDKTLKIWDAKAGKELLTLKGHIDSVNSVMFSLDGKRIVSGSNDGTIKIWDVATGNKMLTLTGHTGPVKACVFSSDGKQVISASEDGTIKIWNAKTGKEAHTIVTNHLHGVMACAISPDGKIVVSAGYWTLTIWDIESGEMLDTISGFEKSVRACAFSPDGGRIVSTGFDPALKIRESKTRHMTMEISTEHSLPVNACVYSPDGRSIASGSDDGRIKLWDVATGNEMLSLSSHTGPINACAFSPDGNRLVSASKDGTLKIWDVSVIAETNESHQRCGIVLNSLEDTETRVPFEHHTSVKACTFSPDGKRVFSGSDDGIFVWDAETGMKIEMVWVRKVDPWLEPIACAFSPNGKGIAIGEWDGSLYIWTEINGLFSKNQPCRLVLPYHPKHKKAGTSKKRVTACAFSSDGRKIVSGSEDGTLTMWTSIPQTLAHKLLYLLIYFMWDKRLRWRALSFPGHQTEVTTCAISPNGRRIISSGWDFKLWDVKSRKEMLTLTGSRGTKTPCAFSLDGGKIACVSETTIKILDGETGAELRTLPGHNGTVLKTFAFSPSGKTIASAGWKSIKIWDIESGRELHTFIDQKDEVCSIAFSPKGEKIVLASKDNTIKICNAETGEEILDYVAQGPLSCCAFSPRGDMVCCGDEGGNVYLLRLFGLDG